MEADKLIKLFETNKEEAWITFQNQYTDYIFTLIKRNVGGYDEDIVHDTYTYILGKLQENDFRRITSYEAKSQFTTFLTKVCQNLIIDFIGKKRRLPKAIQQLDETHQLLFRLYYLQGLGYEECYGIMTINHKIEISNSKFRDIFGEVTMSLSDKNIWKQVQRNAVLESLDKEYENGQVREFPDMKLLTPEDELLRREATEEYEVIKRSLSEGRDNLTVEERLVLELKFQQDLPAAEISKVINMSQRKVYLLIDKICEKLQRHLKEAGYDKEAILGVLKEIELVCNFTA